MFLNRRNAAIKQLSANEDFDSAVISDCSKLVQDFIENYHEKSEEEFLFPRFRKANQLVDLVTTLLEQHQAGRNITFKILKSHRNCGATLRQSETASMPCRRSSQCTGR